MPVSDKENLLLNTIIKQLVVIEHKKHGDGGCCCCNDSLPSQTIQLYQLQLENVHNKSEIKQYCKNKHIGLYCKDTQTFLFRKEEIFI